MRKMLHLIWANMKKVLKQRSSLLILIIIPLGGIAFTWFVNAMDEPEGAVRKTQLVYYSQAPSPGPYLQRIIDAADFERTSNGELDEALEELKHYRLLSVVEAPPDFEEVLSRGEKPKIRLYKVDEGNVTVTQEQAVEAEINAILREVRLAPYTTDPALLKADLIETEVAAPPDTATMEETMPILMLMFFMSFVMSPISEQLIRLRRDRIFERLLSTANSGMAIMGSLFLAYAILQMFFFGLGYLAMTEIFGFTSANVPVTLLYILLMGVVNISLSLFLTRWIRSEQFVSAIASLLSVLLFFLYMISIMPFANQAMTDVLAKVNLFSPFYWAASGVEKGVLFPNLPILILIILVLFTAGSLRVRSYAMDN